MLTSKMKDITGQRFGRLIAVECLGSDPTKVGKSARWECRCDCGNTTIGTQKSLQSGIKKSCGCLQKETGVKTCVLRNTTHNKSKTKEYRAWKGMIGRCYNKMNKRYCHYGGRGIQVCERWRHCFENFLEDMGECPDKFSLDRVNVDGNYCPENCRWADQSTQVFNRRLSTASKTGRSGVSWRENRNTYEVTIGVKNKRIHVGNFKTFEEACEARTEAELKYHGYTKE